MSGSGLHSLRLASTSVTLCNILLQVMVCMACDCRYITCVALLQLEGFPGEAQLLNWCCQADLERLRAQAIYISDIWGEELSSTPHACTAYSASFECWLRRLAVLSNSQISVQHGVIASSLTGCPFWSDFPTSCR